MINYFRQCYFVSIKGLTKKCYLFPPLQFTVLALHHYLLLNKVFLIVSPKWDGKKQTSSPIYGQFNLSYD